MSTRGGARRPGPLRLRLIRWGRQIPARVLAVGIMLFAAAGALVADRLYGNVRAELLRESVRGESAPTAASLGLALNVRLTLLTAVSSFLELNWNEADLDRRFDIFTGDLLQDIRGIRSIQYVTPEGVITHSFPLVGNEAAIGRNLLLDPRPMLHRDFARALISREAILSGPLELYQGGVGLIGRVAVRLPNNEVVGVAAVVLDLAPVLEAGGFGPNGGLEVLGVSAALLDEQGVFISGDSSILADPNADPVRTRVPLPDREWQLLAVVEGGWAATLAERRRPMRLALLVMVVLTGGLIWGLVGRQEARAEMERLRGEEKFARLFAMTPDGVLLTRLSDGTILEANPGFSEITGRPRELLIGASTVALKLWPVPEDREEMLRAITPSGELHDFAVAVLRPDGSMRDTRLGGRVVDLDGEQCLISILRDVTEQRKLERRLAKAARLESIGRLAGGVAHDFNNLITAISGYGHLLRERLVDQPEDLADIEEILRSSSRAAELTSQLLAFARRQVVQPRSVDVNAIVVDAFPRLQHLCGESVTLVTRLSPEPVFVHVDPAQCDQLLTNLVVNARDALPEGGTVEIRATSAEGLVHLSVEDDGVGMTTEVLAHLFEPFFTTKRPGQGTGLGLATCHGIMEQAGGSIDVTSAPGEGTTFTCRFPLVEAGLTAEAIPEDVAVAAFRGGETILLAEDEAQVRRLVERVLGNLGYTVLSASNGADALSLASIHPEAISLLITDMIMPGMGGGELARSVRERHPETKILLISGYSEELIAAEHGDTPFLPKPFTPDELSAAVARVLGS